METKRSPPSRAQNVAGERPAREPEEEDGGEVCQRARDISKEQGGPEVRIRREEPSVDYETAGSKKGGGQTPGAGPDAEHGGEQGRTGARRGGNHPR